MVFDVWMEGYVKLLYVIGRSVLELCGQSCLRLILNFDDQAKKMQAINLWSVSR